MRLSQAIRLGSMLRPQLFGHYGNEIGTCALGAALDAVGALDPNTLQIPKEHFPVLDLDVVDGCPACGHMSKFTRTTVQSVIVHMNDGHKFTREFIADWVETVEFLELAKQAAANVIPAPLRLVTA